MVSSILVVSHDMTERRQMLASLAEKERLASVGMLAASVAHEIMNPLTYVLANLDFVVGERSTDAARNTKALVEAREGARRMQQIVWDLRALGRTGGEELFYVDARSVLEIALRLSGPEVARTASVVLELDEVPCVLASESRLCQVFINLLVNAAQAMETRAAEGREIRVKTRHDEDASLVGIDVADNGEGSPPSASRGSSSPSTRRRRPAPASASRSVATSSSAWAVASTSRAAPARAPRSRSGSRPRAIAERAGARLRRTRHRAHRELIVSAAR